MVPLRKETADLVTWDIGKAEARNDSVFTGKCSSHTPQVAKSKGRDWENEEPLALGEGKFLRPEKEPEGA